MTGPTAHQHRAARQDFRRKDDGVHLRRILRLAPWSVRSRIYDSVDRRILPRVAPERRLAVARRVVPLSYPPRLPTMGGRDDAPTMRVRTGHGRVTARRDAAASPTAVRRANLDRVVAALDTAGVDWFRIPTAAFRSTAVAVPADDRARVMDVLEELVAADHGRLEARLPTRRRRSHARRHAAVVRVHWPVTDPHGSLLLGAEYGCEVEFWQRRDDTLVGPRPNPVSDVITLDEPVTVASETVFSAFSSPHDTATYRTRAVFTMTDPERVAFPIDVVYTWVDGSDPTWQARKARALGDNTWVAAVNEQAANNSRFASRDELRHSLRSLHCFAPWVRHVYLVTDDQVPAWLDLDHPGITLVSHREVFGDTGRLPTFNSQAIESRLHRIPGLSEHFLYINDDVFFGRPVTPDLFFTPGGLTRIFPSAALVDSAPRTAADPPVNSAGKNNRTLIKEAFGRVLTRKMMHTPHPSRRSVIAEIEERFAEHVEATAGHQFRHPDDISLLSSLQQYYAYLTGRATAGTIRYLYADLADPRTPIHLAKLLRYRHLDVFCLNDTQSDNATADEQAQLLADFLPAYLPFRSPFELQAPRPGTAAPAAAPSPAAPVPVPVAVAVARQPTRHRNDQPVPHVPATVSARPPVGQGAPLDPPLARLGAPGAQLGAPATQLGTTGAPPVSPVAPPDAPVPGQNDPVDAKRGSSDDSGRPRSTAPVA